MAGAPVTRPIEKLKRQNQPIRPPSNDSPVIGVPPNESAPTALGRRFKSTPCYQTPSELRTYKYTHGDMPTIVQR